MHIFAGAGPAIWPAMPLECGSCTLFPSSRSRHHPTSDLSTIYCICWPVSSWTKGSIACCTGSCFLLMLTSYLYRRHVTRKLMWCDTVFCLTSESIKLFIWLRHRSLTISLQRFATTEHGAVLVCTYSGRMRFWKAVDMNPSQRDYCMTGGVSGCLYTKSSYTY